MDNYRYALLAKSLKRIGFDAADYKNVKLVRPSDIMKVVPVTYKTGNDTGNYVYGKIEAKSRKTDPFMALVASTVIEDELDTGESVYDDLPVIT